MFVTSAEANKLLKKLQDEERFLQAKEDSTCKFNASLGEDVESVRPDYNFSETNEKLESVTEKIRKVKHAINQFNIQTEVCGLTIDQVLILLPQLKARQRKLYEMANLQPKVRDRVAMARSGVVDYVYANYDVEEAKRAYDEISERISRLQLELDQANSTLMMEIIDM